MYEFIHFLPKERDQMSKKEIFKLSQTMGNSNMAMNPAGAARPAGSQVANGVTVSFNPGQGGIGNIMLETNLGHVQIQLTAQQQAQMVQQFKDLIQ